ncbi:MAG: beta-lactamase family protein [Ruminococcaceae bacterium]|jgi:CubicO group peptidase (beta-lactamase class C family)|nr:beta-lactamase family protein [Oscillospiraceae bacterium]
MTFIEEKTPYSDAFPLTVRRVCERVGTQYSCAAVAVVRGDETLLKFSVGNRRDYSGTELGHPDPKPVTEKTLFDMASVSKLMSTTMVALRMMEEGAFSPYDSLWRFLDYTGNYNGVELRHLMNHTSGLSPHIPLYSVCESPDDAVRTILDSEPLGAPGEEVRYSCMGYILFQRILETIAGAPLDKLADELVFSPLGMRTACYNPLTRPDLVDPEDPDIASTELSSHTGYYICGHVHDENAHFLGGVSGNAGVFASLDDTIRFAKMLSNRGSLEGKRFLNRRTFELAIRDFTAGLDEDRGFGFSLRHHDLSASGEFTTPGSYGHNGYTGTSVYCDARTGIAVVLLTNSVHYGRDNRGPFFRDRRIFHNVVLTEADRALGLDVTKPGETPWGAPSFFD